MLDDIKVGDELTISNPAGDFGFNKIKDEKNFKFICCFRNLYNFRD